METQNLGLGGLEGLASHGGPDQAFVTRTSLSCTTHYQFTYLFSHGLGRIEVGFVRVGNHQLIEIVPKATPHIREDTGRQRASEVDDVITVHVMKLPAVHKIFKS